MKVFVDENLSPRLVSIGHARGYDTTCARDRGLLGAPDSHILEFCVSDDLVCVTNDADDFVDLVGNVELHPGLILLPMVDLARQQQLLEAALEFIQDQADAAEQGPRDHMVNRVVEIDREGTCEAFELPPPESPAG